MLLRFSQLFSDIVQGTNASRPVLFWMHGGSNVDDSKDSYPNLSNFALFKDFVVVSANSRLGALGFLALPELSARDPRGVC